MGWVHGPNPPAGHNNGKHPNIHNRVAPTKLSPLHRSGGVPFPSSAVVISFECSSSCVKGSAAAAAADSAMFVFVKMLASPGPSAGVVVVVDVVNAVVVVVVVVVAAVVAAVPAMVEAVVDVVVVATTTFSFLRERVTTGENTEEDACFAAPSSSFRFSTAAVGLSEASSLSSSTREISDVATTTAALAVKDALSPMDMAAASGSAAANVVALSVGVDADDVGAKTARPSIVGLLLLVTALSSMMPSAGTPAIVPGTWEEN
jgi:uncharacterized membrane protein